MNSCFLLLIPIFIWNLIFTSKLTEVGYMATSIKLKKLEWFENILRVFVFTLPVFMRFDISSTDFIKHINLYAIGVVIYFISWLMIIYFPNSYWSTSMIGLLAPAYTPIIWLIAIGLLGRFKIYNYLSLLFVVVHIFSSYIKLRGSRMKKEANIYYFSGTGNTEKIVKKFKR